MYVELEIDGDCRDPIVVQTMLWLSITMSRVYENYGVINGESEIVTKFYDVLSRLYRREISDYT